MALSPESQISMWPSRVAYSGLAFDAWLLANYLRQREMIDTGIELKIHHAGLSVIFMVWHFSTYFLMTSFALRAMWPQIWQFDTPLEWMLPVAFVTYLPALPILEGRI